MIQPAQPQQTDNPAVRNGLIFGAILAGVNILNVLIQWISGSYQAIAQASSGAVTGIGAGALFGCLAFLVGLALCFISGMNSASYTGQPGSGAVAGLITGLVGELIGGVLSLIVLAAFVLPNLSIPAGSGLSAAQVSGVIIGEGMLALILGLIIDGGIGAGIGYFGGLVGKNNYTGPFAGYPPVTGYPQWYYPTGGGPPLYPVPPTVAFPPPPLSEPPASSPEPPPSPTEPPVS